MKFRRIKASALTLVFLFVLLFSNIPAHADGTFTCEQIAATDTTVTMKMNMTPGYSGYYCSVSIETYSSYTGTVRRSIKVRERLYDNTTFTISSLNPKTKYIVSLTGYGPSNATDAVISYNAYASTTPIVQNYTGPTYIDIQSRNVIDGWIACEETGQRINVARDTTADHTNSYQLSGLSPNREYTVNFYTTCLSGENMLVSSQKMYTSGNDLHVTESGRVSWNNSVRGRGYVCLNWSAMPGAVGYRLNVKVYGKGNIGTYDLGNVTSWDSRLVKVFPGGSECSEAFTDLADILDGASDNSYHFIIYPYYNGFNGVASEVCVTLPNATDKQAPQVTGVQVSGGASNVSGRSVTLDLTGYDPPVANYTASDTSDDASGVNKFLISNDGFITQTAVAATSQVLSNYTWNLTAGEGQKTISVKAVDAAGNISAINSATVNLINDVTPPVVSVSVNNGAVQTDSRHVSLVVSANDNLTTVDNLQERVSTDGTNWYSYNGTSWVSGWGSYRAVTDKFDLGTSGGKKYIYVQIKDQNGNVGNAIGSISYTTASTVPTVSSTVLAPTVNAKTNAAPASNENLDGRIISHKGANTQVVQGNTASLELTGLSNISYIQLSYDSVTWGAPEVLATGATTFSKNLVFAGEGEKKVYIKMQSRDGAESTIYEKAYYIDSEPPTVEIETASGAYATSGSSIELVIKARDNVAPNSSLMYAIRGYSYTALPLDGVVTVSLPSGTGLKTIVIKVVDEAGNVTSRPVKVWRL